MSTIISPITLGALTKSNGFFGIATSSLQKVPNTMLQQTTTPKQCLCVRTRMCTFTTLWLVLHSITAPWHEMRARDINEPVMRKPGVLVCMYVRWTKTNTCLRKLQILRSTNAVTTYRIIVWILTQENVVLHLDSIFSSYSFLTGKSHARFRFEEIARTARQIETHVVFSVSVFVKTLSSLDLWSLVLSHVTFKFACSGQFWRGSNGGGSVLGLQQAK